MPPPPGPDAMRNRSNAALIVVVVLVILGANAVTLLVLGWGWGWNRQVAVTPRPADDVGGFEEDEEPLEPLPDELTVEKAELPPGEWPAGRAMKRLGDPRLLHGAGVGTLAFRPDGKSLFSVGDRVVCEWDVATGQELGRREPKAGDRFRLVLLAAVGNRVVEVGPDAEVLKVTLFDWTTHKEVWSGPLRPTPKGHRYQTLVSPDGRHMTVLVGNAVSVWDLDGRDEVRVLTGGDEDYTAAAFTPDGGRLVVGDAKHTLRVWAVTGDAPPRVFGAGAGNEVGGLAVSPDGRRLASVGRRTYGDERLPEGLGSYKFDTQVRLWDLDRGEPTGTVEAYPEGWAKTGAHPAHSELIFLDAGTLLTASGTISPNFVRRWDVAKAERLPDFPVPLDRLFTFAVSPDGKTLAAATQAGRVCLFDVATGRERVPVEAHREEIQAVAFSADGATVFTAAADGVRTWEAGAGRPTARYRVADPLMDEVSLSADGRVLVTHSYRQSRTATWDLTTRRRLADFGRFMGSTPRLSADGSLMASELFDGDSPRVGVWDARTGERLWARDVPGTLDVFSPLRIPAFSPDGRRLFAGRSRVVVYAARSGEEVARWDPREARVVAPDDGPAPAADVAVSPDGRVLAVGGHDATELVLADADRGTVTRRIETASPTPLAFAPDGRTLAAGSGWEEMAVRLWDPETGEKKLEFTNLPAKPLAFAFSPDGRRLAAGCIDGTTLVWDLRAK